MTIYVDELTNWGKKGTWAHMATDGPLDELHAMAAKIGLKRAWFQGGNSRHPHYDLRESKRLLAVQYGAQEVTGVELVLSAREGERMTYMSPLQKHGNGRWCKLAAGKDADLSELHGMAVTLGLGRISFNGAAPIPHYHLPANLRKLAMKKGVQAMSRPGFFAMCAGRRQQTTGDKAAGDGAPVVTSGTEDSE